MTPKRNFFAPEVVQTSNMDCGPASLKCLLEGLGITVSYGRLREACQTSIDGTSIDTMEAVAGKLGLEAEQIIIPADHVLLSAAGTFPSIVVVRLATGLTHFVVLWRKHGGVVQVMDPATGRRWPSSAQFLQEIYTHSQPVPAEACFEFAQSEDFQRALRQRVQSLCGRAGKRLIESALTNWQAMAALDAAVRLAHTLGVVHVREAVRVIESLTRQPELIPQRYWFAYPRTNDAEAQVMLRGAVLVRVRGRRAAVEAGELPRELSAAVKESAAHPVRELIRIVHEGGKLSPAIVVTALAISAVGVMAEAVLFRGLFDLSRELGLTGQRLTAMIALAVFSAALLLFEVPAFAIILRLARRVENHLRLAFLHKIPRLGDRYFQSRLTSDMAERSHTAQRLRHLPDVARQLLRSIFELCATVAGIVWLDPGSTTLALLAAGTALVPPFVLQPLLGERDLRLRNHAASLTRYYLDAMLGLVPIRAHRAERALRRQHDRQLEKWAESGFSFQRAVLGLEAFQSVTIFALIAWLLLSRLGGADVGRMLLLVYWALNIPTLSQDISGLARQLPYYRNLTLRLLEPLGAPEEGNPSESTSALKQSAPRIEFRQVHVEAGGNTILKNVNLSLEPGWHIGIVGRSGAGKSSLVGILLGWLRQSQGEVLIDGRPLDCEALRRRTVWVDPSVQLWNKSLFDNLQYGNHATPAGLESAIDAALLRDVLEHLPDGMQTMLGEGGGMLSGGQGQRVRLGRGMLRRDATLVILDEPFRGLDRQRRRDLLARAREFWKHATLICITHDIDETRSFDRVLVIEDGHIVEDGQGPRYTQLLNAETDVRTGIWSEATWRKVRIEGGQLKEEEAERQPEPISKCLA
jgi:ATP-binding cassette subfamily B protein